MGLLSGKAAGQASGRLRGTVVDSLAKPVARATILLERSKDAALVKTVITDDTGHFEFEGLLSDVYILSVTAVGFEKLVSGPITIDSVTGVVDLPVMGLRRKSIAMLKEVVIVGQKPFIEQKLDRVVVNVDAQITSAGTNILELMEKLPGVTVGNEGDISLKGKDGVTIYIDDRPTYLSGSALANYLRSLPSALVDKIEIMTNPPAKYDAAGNAGIINIRTKKVKLKGLNGGFSSNYSQGIYWRNDNTLNLNYRVGKVNFFAIGGNNIQNTFREVDFNRASLSSDGLENYGIRQDFFQKTYSSSGNLKLGLDYNLNKNTTVGIMLNGNVTSGNQKANTTSTAIDSLGNVDSLLVTKSIQQNTWHNGSANLNFNHQFDNAGQSISVDIDYVNYHSNGPQTFHNSTLWPDGALKDSQELVSNLPSVINIYSAKADYTHPLAPNARIEGGLKSSYVKTDSREDFFDKDEGVLTPDYGNTNHFLYNERISAGYVNFSKDFRKWSVQGGLRVENTLSEGHQLGNPQIPDSSFRRSYTDFFPTAYLSYKFDTNANNQMVFSYGRRIDRPFYQDLNPFLFYVDNYTYIAGNPFLKPEFSNNIELSHVYKNRITTTLSYSIANDIMSPIVQQVGNVLISSTGNIGKRVSKGISVTASFHPLKWWFLNVYTEVVDNHFTGFVDGQNLDVGTPYWLGNVNNQLRFNKGWSAELLAFYRTRTITGQFEAEPIWKVNAGIAKKILKQKGSVKLSLRDIFNTYQPKGKVDNIPFLRESFSNHLDSRIAVISFSYTFGKTNNNSRRRQSAGGADTEESRIKNN